MIGFIENDGVDSAYKATSKRKPHYRHHTIDGDLTETGVLAMDYERTIILKGELVLIVPTAKYNDSFGYWSHG